MTNKLIKKKKQEQAAVILLWAKTVLCTDVCVKSQAIMYNNIILKSLVFSLQLDWIQTWM